MTDAPNPAALAARPRHDAEGHVKSSTAETEVAAEVEAALGPLEALPDLAVTDHVAVFEGVQQRLSEILSNVDDV